MATPVNNQLYVSTNVGHPEISVMPNLNPAPGYNPISNAADLVNFAKQKASSGSLPGLNQYAGALGKIDPNNIDANGFSALQAVYPSLGDYSLDQLKSIMGGTAATKYSNDNGTLITNDSLNTTPAQSAQNTAVMNARQGGYALDPNNLTQPAPNNNPGGGNPLPALANGQQAGGLNAAQGAASNTENPPKYDQQGNLIPGTGGLSAQGFLAAKASGQQAPQDSGTASQQVSGFTPPAPADNSAKLASIDQQLSQDPGYQALLKDQAEYSSAINQSQSLSQTYTDLTNKLGIPAMDSQLINWKNVIDGTEEDIRNEIQKSGGFGTNSQVLALASSRNDQLIKNYNNLLQTKQQAENTLNTMVGLASQDKQMALQNITEKMQIDQQISQYRDKFTSAAKEGYNNVLNAVGYGGLLAMLHSDPTAISGAEKSLGLQPGGLQQLVNYQQNQTNLKAIQAQNIGTPYTNVGGEIQDSKTGQGFTSEADFQAKTGMSVQQALAKNLITNLTSQNKLTEVSPGSTLYDPITGKAVYTAPTAASQNGGGGGGSNGGYIPGTDPITDSWVTAVKNGNATMAQVPAAYRNQVALGLTTGGSSVVNPQTDAQVKAIIAANPGEYGHAADAIDKAFGAGTASKYDSWLKGVYNQGKDINTVANSDAFSPLAGSRFTMEANRIVNNFVQLPQYQLTANGLPYLQRIQAAMQTPGSISDQDLLDSLTKLNTSGNAISDAQVKLVTGGQSFADMASTLGNKFKNGGVLSDSQRQQIQKIAQAIYTNYQQGYQPVYDQVTKQLNDAGIPKQFWTIPDLNTLSGQNSSNGGDYNSYLQAIGGGQ